MQKKWPVVFFCIVIAAIVLIEGCTSPRIDDGNRKDSNGLTSTNKIKAIGIALENTDVKSYLSGQESGKLDVKEVTRPGLNGAPGYINAGGLIVQVTIEYPNYIGKNKVLVLVDTNTSKVMDVEWYSYRGGLPMFANATVPPGACWYHTINMAGQSLVFSVSGFTPGNTTIYPVIVDGENLDKLKNGSAYDAAELIDRDTGNMTTINGSEPITQQWGKNLSIASTQPAEKSPVYYLVLWNSDKSRDVSISYAS